jgi:integrase
MDGERCSPVSRILLREWRPDARRIRSHVGYRIAAGELLGLRWDDFDLETGSAQIRSQLQCNDGRLVMRPTKTISSEAVLPCRNPACKPFAEHRLTVEHRADAGKAWHENDLVFSTRDGLPLDPRNRSPRRALAKRLGD